MLKDELKVRIKQSVIDAVYANKERIINHLVEQKQMMFDDNTHEWSELLAQTIARKSRYKDLFRSPQSINIRHGGLFKTLTNSSNYVATNDNEQIDFNIELDDKSTSKVQVVASYNRDVMNITNKELNQISDSLSTIISNNIRENYE